MGLLDFAKDLGRKLFDTDAEAADRIRESIEITLSPIDNLDVQYDDGVVTLCGDCPTEGTRELAILTAGNVQGVTQVIADKLTAPPAPAAEEANFEYYVVQSGDSLSKIAKQYYGDAMQYSKIFEANREMIRDADKIYPGQKIRIPV